MNNFNLHSQSKTGHKSRRVLNRASKRLFYSNSKASLHPPAMRALSEAPIAIVGGGIGGTTLALALQKQGIPFRLFEKDVKFTARRQGYGLTLQQGIMPLRELGFTNIVGGVVSTSHGSYLPNGDILGIYGHNVWDEKGQNGAVEKRKIESKISQHGHDSNDLSNHSVNPSCLQNRREYDQDTSDKNQLHSKTACSIDSSSQSDTINRNEPNVISIVGKARHNVHLPRQRLREMLLNEIDTSNILWNKKIVDYTDSCNGEKVTLHFSDDSIFQTSLLVAADGIHSVIRQIKLPEASLEYLGLIVILGITENLDSEMDMKHVRQWLDGTSRVFAMPFDGDKTMWQMSFPVEEREAVALSVDSRTLLDGAIARCGSWNTDLSRLLRSTDEALVSGHPVYDRAPLEAAILRGHPQSRVTMIGDAVHPMSPFKGQGANQAMLDATSLARAISDSDLVRSNRRNICESLAFFETEMLRRSSPKVLKSRKAATALHSSAALVVGNLTRAWVAGTADGSEVNNNNNIVA